MQRRKPAPTKGIAHLVAATGHSLAGLRALWSETAFRQEVAIGAVAIAFLWAIGAALSDIAVFAVLLLVLLAVEAVNTAIEVIVDRLSPEWSDFARHAKDVGSAAVFLVILANALWLCLALYRLL